MATWTDGTTVNQYMLQALDDRVTALETAAPKIDRGYQSGVLPDANGILVINHGLGVNPKYVDYTPGPGQSGSGDGTTTGGLTSLGPFTFVTKATSSTTINVQVWYRPSASGTLAAYTSSVGSYKPAFYWRTEA